jgi:hypothetical protein
VLIKLGFKSLIANDCIYRHPESGLIVITYVDDFLLVGLKGKELADLKAALQNAFEIKDLGPCYYFVGSSGTEVTGLYPLYKMLTSTRCLNVLG